MIAIGSDHGGYKLKEQLKHYFDEMQIPYKDKECTELLDSKYWVRPARSDGSPSKDYLLLRHKNEWDCTVKFSGEQYPLVHENNADVPYDVETKYYQLPDNYNIYYIDRE